MFESRPLQCDTPSNWVMIFPVDREGEEGIHIYCAYSRIFDDLKWPLTSYHYNINTMKLYGVMVEMYYISRQYSHDLI